MWIIFPTQQSLKGGIFELNNLSCGQISPRERFFSTGTALWCLWQISGMSEIFWSCTIFITIKKRRKEIITQYLSPHNWEDKRKYHKINITAQIRREKKKIAQYLSQRKIEEKRKLHNIYHHKKERKKRKLHNIYHRKKKKEKKKKIAQYLSPRPVGANIVGSCWQRPASLPSLLTPPCS